MCLEAPAPVEYIERPVPDALAQWDADSVESGPDEGENLSHLLSEDSETDAAEQEYIPRVWHRPFADPDRQARDATRYRCGLAAVRGGCGSDGPFTSLTVKEQQVRWVFSIFEVAGRN